MIIKRTLTVNHLEVKGIQNDCVMVLFCKEKEELFIRVSLKHPATQIKGDNLEEVFNKYSDVVMDGVTFEMALRFFQTYVTNS